MISCESCKIKSRFCYEIYKDPTNRWRVKPIIRLNPIWTGVLAAYGKTALLQVTTERFNSVSVRESGKMPFLEPPDAYALFLQKKKNTLMHWLFKNNHYFPKPIRKSLPNIFFCSSKKIINCLNLCNKINLWISSSALIQEILLQKYVIITDVCKNFRVVSPVTQKVCLRKIWIKTMIVTFLHPQGFIH